MTRTDGAPIQVRCLPQSDPQELLAMETGCLVVGVGEGARNAPLLQAMDAATNGLLGRLRASGELPAKDCKTLVVQFPPGLKAERLLLVGVGKSGFDTASAMLEVARAAAAALLHGRASSAVWALGPPGGQGASASQWVALSTRALCEANYRFDMYRKRDEAPEPLSRNVGLVVEHAEESEAGSAVRLALATANGVELARRLGDAPGNICTPAYLAEAAIALAASGPVKVEVFDRDAIGDFGLGAFLAVARGSDEEPRLIVVRYNGGSAGQAPVALVGKGVTFDSGGISIKPSAAMDEMKYDMCGAAAVLGVIRACIDLELAVNVVGVIVACENMPAGNALKPGDVIRSLSGKTIEVLNTDAEGRLALCDALTYARQRFEPDTLIDIATLTGACVVALGDVNSGLFANDDALALALLEAGRWSGDHAWRMPLDKEYRSQIVSTIADMKNDGGRKAGSVTAASFLSRFVGDEAWAHLDIAGTAWKSGSGTGATGRPVPMLVRYLSERAHSA